MLDPEDLRWFKGTTNELNNLLQVIAESTQVLDGLCRGQTGAERYLGILHSASDRATRVTRQMAERVGGYHSTEMPPGEIAAPEVRLVPPAMVPQRSAPASPVAVEIHNPTGERELILIVDDEDFVTMLARRVLTDEGYRVVTAKNGFQALDIYRRLGKEVALTILDFTMPVMDGSDVFAELQLLDPAVTVMLSSGFAEQERLRSMLARGLRGFIPKPYTHQKLLAQVRQTLDQVAAERSGERRVL